MRLLGLDPGLRNTGWGVIDVEGNRLKHVAQGVATTHADAPLAIRLGELYRLLGEVLDRFLPDAAAVEETFVNKNPGSTLKLGMARGVVLLAPAERGIPVFEYATNLVKKSVVGVGHADKAQVQMMVRRLLPGAAGGADASDALAVAICHAHHAATRVAWTPSPQPSPQRGEGGSVAPIDTLSPAGRGKGEGAKRKPTSAETARARRLRRAATDAETLLWGKLRNAQLENAKFRRQEPILGFTADFVCHEKRLVIEIDGGQHAWQEDRDERRTKLLAQAGFRVVRFWNNDVIQNIDGVLERLRESRGSEPVIAMLAGRVDQTDDDSIVIDVNGVGYLVFASRRTLAKAPARGEPLRLLIETHVREDHIHLYGFVDEAEREWFRLLTTVQGVGARIALAILSALAPDALATAIAAQDKAALTEAEGVGPKLGQRIVIELKDKVGGIALGPAVPAPLAAASEAVSALVNLGYPRSDAHAVVAAASRRLGSEASLDALIRAGLKDIGIKEPAR